MKKVKFYKRILLPLVVIMLIFSVSGYTKTTETGGLSNTQDLPITVEGNNYPLKIKDFLKKETILEKKPEKVAVLSGTPLNIWYDLGGKSICTSNITDNLKLISEYKKEINDLPQIGPVYSIDMESVVSLKPDLIIAQAGTQGTQADKLRDIGFKVITTNIRSYDDVIATYNAFGKILGNEKSAEAKIEALKNKKEEIVSKLPKDNKSVVILYITAKTIAVKLDNSIAGDVAKILKLDNIASDLPPDTIGSETTPLDVEYIVKKNPDYVLVTSMISDDEEAKKTMEEEFKSNPVWKGVKAVQEGRVIYLPQQYFLYNAGPYYSEAIEYMAKSIYPEIYGEVTHQDGK